MTGFLASVRNATEARQVLALGVDILDAKEPGSGALGAVAGDVLRGIVAAAGGRVPVSATVGDLPLLPDALGPAMERTWSVGVDIVKVGVFGESVPEPVLTLLANCCARGMGVVLVYFAEHWHGDTDFALLARTGIAGVMLDTRDKQAGALPDRMEPFALQSFISGARRTGLVAGLAGSLREQDIPLLLALAPDYLGFRGALCGGAGRGGAIDDQAVGRITAQVRSADIPGVSRRGPGIRGNRARVTIAGG